MRNKYLIIYQEMAQKIEKETFKANEFLPSENELAEQYQTSRETIRKALNLLAQNGYIQKIRGKGSTVIERNKFDFPVSGLVSFKELADKMGEKPITTVHQCAKVSANEFIQKQLKLADNQEVWEIIRTRSFSGQRVILDKDYLITRTVQHISKDIAEASIYDYLENNLGLIISFAKKKLLLRNQQQRIMSCWI